MNAIFKNPNQLGDAPSHARLCIPILTRRFVPCFSGIAPKALSRPKRPVASLIACRFAECGWCSQHSEVDTGRYSPVPRMVYSRFASLGNLEERENHLLTGVSGDRSFFAYFRKESYGRTGNLTGGLTPTALAAKYENPLTLAPSPGRASPPEG